jgi:hypothetical protein
MALIRKMRGEAPELEKVACVTAICALAGLPLAVCAAVTIFGRGRPHPTPADAGASFSRKREKESRLNL